MGLEATSSYCMDDCPGYNADPKPGHLWAEDDDVRVYTDPDWALARLAARAALTEGADNA